MQLFVCSPVYGKQKKQLLLRELQSSWKHPVGLGKRGHSNTQVLALLQIKKTQTSFSSTFDLILLILAICEKEFWM